MQVRTRGSSGIPATLARNVPAERRSSRLSAARVGRNEALARRPADSRPPTERMSFSCECEGQHCRETVVLTRAGYEHVRAQAGALLVAPGHQVPGTEVAERLEGCFVLRPLTRR
jgi:hypothetical protein